MNILILAYGDWSGAGHALAEAIREHTTHSVVQVAMKQYWTEYPADVIAPNQSRLSELLDWADVWNVHDDASLLVTGAKKKPIFLRWFPNVPWG